MKLNGASRGLSSLRLGWWEEKDCVGTSVFLKYRKPRSSTWKYIDLAGARVFSLEAEDAEGHVLIVAARDRTYRFAADTAEDRDQWVAVLASALGPDHRHDDPRRPRDDDGSDKPPEVTPSPFSGVLHATRGGQQAPPAARDALMPRVRGSLMGLGRESVLPLMAFLSRPRVSWSDEYLAALAQGPAHRLPVVLGLFEATAVALTRTIVSEMNLPEERRTVRPVPARGVLTASLPITLFTWTEVFLVGSLALRFVRDAARDFAGRDEVPVKTIRSELRAQAALRRAGFVVPLAALVSYRGFHVLAVAVMPGEPVPLREAVSESDLVDAGAKLGVSRLPDEACAHIAEEAGVVVSSDVAGLFEAGVRPEALRLRVPGVAANARRGGGSSRSSRTEKKEAADSLVAAVASALDSLDELVLGPEDVGPLLHRYGVKVSDAGAVAALVTQPHALAVLEVDMLARAARDTFGRSLRRLSDAGASEADHAEAAVDYFNLVLGLGAEALGTLAEAVKKKFRYSVRGALGSHKAALFLALQHHCGVRFVSTDKYSFDLLSPFAKADFEGFTCASTMAHADDCDGYGSGHEQEQQHQVDLSADGDGAELELDDLLDSLSHQSTRRGCQPTSSSSSSEQQPAAILWRRAPSHLHARVCRALLMRGCWGSAALVARAALASLPAFCGAASRYHLVLAEAHFELGERAEALASLVDGRRVVTFALGADHPAMLDFLALFGRLNLRHGAARTSSEYFSQGHEISRRVLGEAHPATAKFALLRGSAYRALGMTSIAVSCFETAAVMGGPGVAAPALLHLGEAVLLAGDAGASVVHTAAGLARLVPGDDDPEYRDLALRQLVLASDKMGTEEPAMALLQKAVDACASRAKKAGRAGDRQAAEAAVAEAEERVRDLVFFKLRRLPAAEFARVVRLAREGRHPGEEAAQAVASSLLAEPIGPFVDRCISEWLLENSPFAADAVRCICSTVLDMGALDLGRFAKDSRL